MNIATGALAPHVVERTCEVCSSSDAVNLPHYGNDHWPVAGCASCGFVYMPLVPTYDALATDFPWEITYAAEKMRRERSRVGWLDKATRWRTALGHVADRRGSKRTLGADGCVLDVGCGGACRVPQGPTPFGIEISRALALQAAPAFEARGGRVITLRRSTG